MTARVGRRRGGGTEKHSGSHSAVTSVDERMDGRTDRWMDGWMDGWLDRVVGMDGQLGKIQTRWQGWRRRWSSANWIHYAAEGDTARRGRGRKEEARKELEEGRGRRKGMIARVTAYRHWPRM